MSAFPHQQTGSQPGRSRFWNGRVPEWAWSGWRLIWLACLLGAVFGLQAQITVFEERTNTPPRLEMLTREAHGWLRLQGDYYNSNTLAPVLTVQVSADLRAWQDAATLLHAPFAFTDPGSVDPAARYYRLAVTPMTATNDWANQLHSPGDRFFTRDGCASGGTLAWAKFVILLAEPHRVYFQDSGSYPLHYGFATKRLPALAGLTPEQFNDVTLHPDRQRALLGVVYVPQTSPAREREYGIQFIGQEPFAAERVVEWFESVRAAVAAAPGVTAFYVPAFEQKTAALAQRTYFESRGVPLATLDRWTDAASAVYVPGWAAGRLVFVRGPEIAAAYADGRLRPTDILLTDDVPAEVPHVAGILTLSPGSPASHVAILARSSHIPFLMLNGTNLPAQAQSMVGHFVAVRTGLRLNAGEVKLMDLEGRLDETSRDQLARLDEVPFELTPRARYGAYLASASALEPEDLRFFGGKVANFGLLRRVIPAHSPVAIAVSFDLWDDFLDQLMPGGATLRETIAQRLGRFSYPPDVAAVRAELDVIRELIRKTARFTPGQEQAIFAGLAGFDPGQRLRFRSSGNVEDSESFTGAGLYDSYSGCLADDQDADAAGPSRCDPTEPEERGVLRAMRRVYASFYNENAFLERLRLGVDEAAAGMAMLVHESFPDEFELANGVITVTRQTGSAYLTGQIVCQPGAASVTNPDDTAAPEIIGFEVLPGAFGLTNVTVRQSAALLPVGVRVMDWDQDYVALLGLVNEVAQRYRSPHPSKPTVALDLEFKKLRPGRLVIKQLRELPVPDATRPRPVFLLDEPGDWLVAPEAWSLVAGEPFPDSDLFALHRLKSQWRLATTNVLLAATNLTGSLYRNGHFEAAVDLRRDTLEGPPSTWPGAAFETKPAVDPAKRVSVDRWDWGVGADRRDATLLCELPLSVPETESGWRTLPDLSLVFRVKYPAPMPRLEAFGGVPATTQLEAVKLFPAGGRSIQNNRAVEAAGVRVVPWVELFSYLPTPERPPDCEGSGTIDISPFGFVSGRGETTVHGLLDAPLVVRDPYAQTVWVHGRNGHETVMEVLVDPWNEPGLAESVKAELTRRNIRWIYGWIYCFGDCSTRLGVLGLDDQWRFLARP